MMKKTINFLVLFTVIAALSVYVSGCSEDEDTVEPAGNKTALNALITESETLHDAAVEGTSVGFYEVGSKAVFQTSIDAAKAVANTSGAIQSVLDAAEANLDAAKTVFEGKEIQNVSTEGLVAQWLFDGDANDFTGNGNDGTAKTSHPDFGSGIPVLTTDRFGNEDNAYYFNEGANIEVPYTSALNPAQISIALWINATEIRENNRFMGLHSWLGYKFQLQSANYPYFTANTLDGISEKDAESALEINQWYHITVTFGGGEMLFYIDGSLEKTWDGLFDAAMVMVTDHNLAIGVGSSKYADDESNYDVDHIIPAPWGGFFHGKLDDIRLYNRVLSGQEVTSIYNLEKP